MPFSGMFRFVALGSVPQLEVTANVFFWLADSFHLDDGGDTSFRNFGSHKMTRLHIPKDGILHSRLTSSILPLLSM
jgi:hypothetical protein